MLSTIYYSKFDWKWDPTFGLIQSIWYQSKYDHSQSQETNNPVYKHHKMVWINTT